MESDACMYGASFSVMHLFLLKKWLKSKSIYRMFITCVRTLCPSSQSAINTTSLTRNGDMLANLSFSAPFFRCHASCTLIRLSSTAIVYFTWQRRNIRNWFVKPFARCSECIRIWISVCNFIQHSLMLHACMQSCFLGCISTRTLICFFFIQWITRLENRYTLSQIQMHIKYIIECDYLLKGNVYRIEIITHNNITISAIWCMQRAKVRVKEENNTRMCSKISFCACIMECFLSSISMHIAHEYEFDVHIRNTVANKRMATASKKRKSKA